MGMNRIGKACEGQADGVYGSSFRAGSLARVEPGMRQGVWRSRLLLTRS
jgi:hypothetical protein